MFGWCCLCITSHTKYVVCIHFSNHLDTVALFFDRCVLASFVFHPVLIIISWPFMEEPYGKQSWRHLNVRFCCTKTIFFPLSRPWPTTTYTAWSDASSSCGSSSAPKWTSCWQLGPTYTQIHTKAHKHTKLTQSSFDGLCYWLITFLLITKTIINFISRHRHTRTHSGFSGKGNPIFHTHPDFLSGHSSKGCLVINTVFCSVGPEGGWR